MYGDYIVFIKVDVQFSTKISVLRSPEPKKWLVKCMCVVVVVSKASAKATLG